MAFENNLFIVTELELPKTEDADFNKYTLATGLRLNFWDGPRDPARHFLQLRDLKKNECPQC